MNCHKCQINLTNYLKELFFISRRSRENHFQDFFGFPRFARTAGKNDFQDFQDFARLRAGDKTTPKNASRNPLFPSTNHLPKFTVTSPKLLRKFSPVGNNRVFVALWLAESVAKTRFRTLNLLINNL